MGEMVVVSRKWKNPEIALSVNAEGIAIGMKLEDFISSMCEEAGNPTLLLTVSMLKKRLNDAALKVIEEMKLESKRVV